MSHKRRKRTMNLKNNRG